MGLISNGSTVFDNGSMASGFGGSMVFIKKLTASSSATLSFVDGSDGVVLDDTYKEYIFTFNNIHAGTDDVTFGFQADTGTNTNYNQTITSTKFRTLNAENDSFAHLIYQTGDDQANGTNFQRIANELGTDNDQCFAGTLQLFNPSSDTFVKHFIARTQNNITTNYSMEAFTAGYFNQSTALTRVQFKLSSGNIDAGDICLYGIA